MVNKFLVFVLVCLLFVGSSSSVLAQQAEPLAEIPTRWSLFAEQWKDRFSVWMERDESKKAELELKFAEKYSDRLERIESLPESANKERIVETLEDRRDAYINRLEVKIENKEEVKSEIQSRFSKLLEKKAQVKEKVQEKVQEKVGEEMMQQNGEGLGLQQREDESEARNQVNYDKGQGVMDRDQVRDETNKDEMMEANQGEEMGMGSGVNEDGDRGMMGENGQRGSDDERGSVRGAESTWLDGLGSWLGF
jgi:hypothetical protein